MVSEYDGEGYPERPEEEGMIDEEDIEEDAPDFILEDEEEEEENE